jgi:DNA-binding transcriptional LysR family regulator
MDRLDAMTTFVAVAELRGFTAAARRLRRSPSAVTRTIAALEDHLAVQLLQRTTRAVALTDAGVRYLEATRRILAEVDAAEHAARAERAEPAGRFAITAPQVFGRREVGPLVSDFLARYPAVTAELVLSDRVVDLVDEGFDVAIRIGELDDSSLRVRVVGKTRRVVVGSPAYLAAHKRVRSPADLANHALVQLRSLTPTDWHFVRDGAAHRVAVRPVFATNSADAAIQRAERDGGLAMVLAYQVADAVKRGALAIVLSAYEPPPLPIQLVYPPGPWMSATLRAFIDLAGSRRWNFVEL